MQPRKLSVAFCGFPYSGNGAGQAEHPALCRWLVPTIIAAKKDPRVLEVFAFDMADTPITMNRNAAVVKALEQGADVLVMFDSDMHPDLYLGTDPNAKPFFQSAFDFLYDRFETRKTVVAAPYSSAGPHEVPMALEWVNFMTGEVNEGYKLELLGRNEAARRTGFEQMGAVATGLIMYDLRIFQELPQPWFYYEYHGDGPACPVCKQKKAGVQASKASTEDVTNTRDISLFYFARYGYNPLFINWDSWAGHYKTKLVQKPHIQTVDAVGSSLVAAVRNNYRSNEKVSNAGEDSPLTGLGNKVIVMPSTKTTDAPKPTAMNGDIHNAPLREGDTVTELQEIPAEDDGSKEWHEKYGLHPSEPHPTFDPPPDPKDCVAVADEGDHIHRLVRSECVGVRRVGEREVDLHGAKG